MRGEALALVERRWRESPANTRHGSAALHAAWAREAEMRFACAVRAIEMCRENAAVARRMGAKARRQAMSAARESRRRAADHWAYAVTHLIDWGLS